MTDFTRVTGHLPQPDDTPVIKWAKELKPSYLGRVAGGLYGCLLTWVNDEGSFIWSFATGESQLTARQNAVGYMVEQRMKGIMWIPTS